METPCKWLRPYYYFSIGFKYSFWARKNFTYVHNWGYYVFNPEVGSLITVHTYFQQLMTFSRVWLFYVVPSMTEKKGIGALKRVEEKSLCMMCNLNTRSVALNSKFSQQLYIHLGLLHPQHTHEYTHVYTCNTLNTVTVTRTFIYMIISLLKAYMDSYPPSTLNLLKSP